MTRLQWIRTFYNTGLVLQLGHKTYGLYPLRWLGRITLKHGKWCSPSNMLGAYVEGRLDNYILHTYGSWENYIEVKLRKLKSQFG